MKQKRWLSILLSLSLLLTLLPVRAFAEEGTQTACTQTADCPAQIHEPDCPLWQEGETVPEETEAAGPDSTEPEETNPAETVPGETDPAETVSGATGPAETVPGETAPTIPGATDPDSTKPEETVPTVPGETVPDGTEPDETVPEETGATEETQPTAAEVLALIEALPDPSDLTAENAAAVEAQLKELLALYQALDEAGQEEVGDAILRAIELKAALDALSGEDSGQAMLAEIATDVAYINAAYDETTNTVTYKKEIAASATVVDENTTEWAWGVAEQETWYVVQDTATTSDRITVTGDVHLILADGATLTAGAGITVNTIGSNSLTIYGQENGTGTLVATGGENAAGIGGDGSISYGDPAATSGVITINGGIVKATGGENAAGIGGGWCGRGVITIPGSVITINGGTVEATGGAGGAGIGGGNGKSGSVITISGGTVTANGGDGGAGIGGGYESNGENITTSGGTVTANGLAGGAGIGGGSGGSGSNITITGGMVTATSRYQDGYYKGYGAAIGNGASSNSTGTETEESNFTNAVVLRKNGEDTSTLTGTVYGDATLTTDATVPTGATLTVPAASTLTIAEGTTLTNKGTINIASGGTLTNNGTIINNGTITGDVSGNQPGVYVTYQAYDTEAGKFFEATAFATPVTSAMTTLGAGWYVVNSAAADNLTISDRIIVSGDVHLILADGAKLTASKGITVAGTNSLTIYGQTAGTGELSATGGTYQAGIGGNSGNSGAITIHGGTVTAKGGDSSAGIGGGFQGSGTVTINGGTVTATGDVFGAGIGGGFKGSGTVTINGGTVTATGGKDGAGIGTGCIVDETSITATITITGGFVTATGGGTKFSWGAGAAIGSGGGNSIDSTGAEVAENNFNNAVVLRQSGASGSTMTGQVYGTPTLTTDATVPEGASLTIPEGTSLTLARGMTLTNNGTIYKEDGSEFHYSTVENDKYGLLTGNGEVKIGVSYLAYNEETKEFEEGAVYDYTVVTNQTILGAGWYVVNSAAAENLTISDRITVSGDVHLILADGAKLTASAGIGVNTASNSLTIYGQTGGTGELVAGPAATRHAGIGSTGTNSSTADANSGPITINGGVVNATGGESGAGIGGGHSGSGSNITINGGKVTATSKRLGAGIGGGNGGSGSYIIINGGTVTATATFGGAGIGGSNNGSGSYITINGGTVTATGGSYSAGIGGGSNGGTDGSGSGSNITITGGTVTATGGYYAAGIGGSDNGGSGSNITISGGTVTATGGGNGAGIGGGSNSNGGSSGSGSNITITGGFVTATGKAGSNSDYGAGAAIGGGGSNGSTGTEIAESNFTNAVVLRQSGAATTMTGQVYGTPTLTTNAEVPANAALTIPENTTLTVGANTTLTNSGAICMEGGSLQYGDPNYGTLTNGDNGKLYYLLTVTGGTATATEGMATYNGKTYATQGTTVTLTADAKVGQTLTWTAIPTSANVTVNASNQFTMPAQVLTVKAEYENAPAYTVTIPASVDIGKTAEIKAESVNVAKDYSLKVKLTATSDTANAFTLALKNHPEETLAYTVTQNGQNVNVNDTVLTVAGGTANSSDTATLTFALAGTAVARYSDTYSGTVTFTVSVEKDASTGGTD